MTDPTMPMAERTTILRGLVGSTVHGLNVHDATEDRDEMAVCVEDIEHVVGLRPFEQVIYRTAAEREGKHDARSMAGDLDLTIYSLRKYVRLALKGNPTILCLLFVPPDQCTVRTSLGARLQEMAPHIVSRRAISAFLGYLTAQRQRLVGERGQKDVNRPELVEKYGFDCYSDETEFLTRSGWRRYDEITDGMQVATINQRTRQIEFQTPIERVAKEYTGPMIQLRHRYTEALVTPNHRMWTSMVDRGPCGRKGNAYRDADADWYFRPCGDLKGHYHVQVAAIPRTEEYPVSDHFLSLVGAYVSEGHIARRLKNGSPSLISITQKVGGKMESILAETAYPFRTYVYPRKDRTGMFRIYTLANREIACRLASECGEGSRNKRLPSWVFDLSGRQARILLRSLMAGDGTFYERRSISVYYSKSERLAGDVQALALSAGYRSNVWGPYEGMYQVFFREGSPYQAIITQTNTETLHPWSGRIVCFTVPNETLVTRLGGKVSIQGNTKYAMHMLRLGIQGVELGETGRFTLPMPEPERSLLRDVRTGKVGMGECLSVAASMERRLLELQTTSNLPECPDEASVEHWMVTTYYRQWNARAKTVEHLHFTQERS